MRAFLPLLLLALMLALTPASAASRSLLLEMWLDGKSQGRVVPVTLTGDHILIAADDFAALKLSLAAPKPDDQGRVDISALRGLTVSVNESEQRLELAAPANLLPPQLYDLSRAPAEESEGGSGAVLHYDFSGTADDASVWGRHVMGGGELALDIFTPGALINSTGFANVSAAGWRAARLDSSVVFDDPATLRHISIGDAFTTMPAFARAVRFGGVEYAKDFALRPDLDTRPLPQFFGQTAVPATVDVFSGAAQVFESQVQPGPFALNNLPIVSGGGTATIVTRDVLGRQTTQTLSLYTESDLLAPGLSSYAVDAGFLRTFYGITSDGYDTPMASASWRQGLKGVTVEAHGEAAAHQGLLSGGAALGLGDFGALSGDVAGSASPSGSGFQLSLNAHARAGIFTFNAAATSASADYRDLASLSQNIPGQGSLQVPRLSYQFGVTAGLAAAGSLGVSWLGSKFQDGRATDLVSASWTLPLPRQMFLAATALTDIRSRALSAQLALSVPLGGRALGTLSAADQNGDLSGLALYDNPADPDGGFGYRLLTGWEDGGQFEADGQYVGSHFAADAGFAMAGNVPALRGDIDGALVLMKDKLYAIHDPGGAVALVETGDPHVRIYRENRPVAVSDDQGEALIADLNPYAPNHVGVDPRDYAFDTLVEQTDAIVVPRPKSGVLVDLKPRSHHPLLVTVKAAAGSDIPLGARVSLDGGGDPLTVGHDGEIFIPDLDHPAGADIQLSGGGHCRIFIQPAGDKNPMPRVGPLLCLREVASAY